MDDQINIFPKMRNLEDRERERLRMEKISSN